MHQTDILYMLLEILLYGCFFNKKDDIQKFLARFCFFLRSQLSLIQDEWTNNNRQCCVEVKKEIDNQSIFISGKEVETVMGSLGIFCSPESENLKETMGTDEISQLFDEQEPSLDELKEAFDVFDANRDGFIDAEELQRVIRLLGLKGSSTLENCRRMITNFDENRDGRIDFNEFVKFMENHLS